jgi:hypothetical protein
MISALVLLPAPRECDGEACAAVLLSRLAAKQENKNCPSGFTDDHRSPALQSPRVQNAGDILIVSAPDWQFLFSCKAQHQIETQALEQQRSECIAHPPGEDGRTKAQIITPSVTSRFWGLGEQL